MAKHAERAGKSQILEKKKGAQPSWGSSERLILGDKGVSIDSAQKENIQSER